MSSARGHTLSMGGRGDMNKKFFKEKSRFAASTQSYSGDCVEMRFSTRAFEWCYCVRNFFSFFPDKNIFECVRLGHVADLGLFEKKVVKLCWKLGGLSRGGSVRSCSHGG